MTFYDCEYFIDFQNHKSFYFSVYYSELEEFVYFIKINSFLIRSYL